jgi:hypothetical protein
MNKAMQHRKEEGGIELAAHRIGGHDGGMTLMCGDSGNGMGGGPVAPIAAPLIRDSSEPAHGRGRWMRSSVHGAAELK